MFRVLMNQKIDGKPVQGYFAADGRELAVFCKGMMLKAPEPKKARFKVWLTVEQEVREISLEDLEKVELPNPMAG